MFPHHFQKRVNGIMVNSLYCGAQTDREAMDWRQVAQLADGQFAAIDHNSGTVVMPTPMDDQLAALSASLNQTYLRYGKQGDWFGTNQVQQDANASGLNGEAAATRAFCKANVLYNCAAWDLVDAVKDEGFDLAQVKPEDLPESMREMTMVQRHAHVSEFAAARAKIQGEINALAVERQQYLDTSRLEKLGDRTGLGTSSQALTKPESFDNAIRSALRSQARAKGYRFPAEEVLAPVSPTKETVEPASATGATQAELVEPSPVQQTNPGQGAQDAPPVTPEAMEPATPTQPSGQGTKPAEVPDRTAPSDAIDYCSRLVESLRLTA